MQKLKWDEFVMYWDVDTSHKIWTKTFCVLTLALRKIKFEQKVCKNPLANLRDTPRDPDFDCDLRFGTTALGCDKGVGWRVFTWVS
jgi:hypothetical protein